MSENARVGMEIAFNIAYLVAIWAIVAAMFVLRDRVAPGNAQVARIGRWMFLLLAVGDTGHVGFRVWAYASGSLETTITLLGRDVGLVGLGALATALTVTLFYVLLLFMWRARFGKPWGWFGALLLGAAVVRLLLMTPAWNQWSSVVPPQPFSTLRNLPLMLLGLGGAYLILRDARAGRRPHLFLDRLAGGGLLPALHAGDLLRAAGAAGGHVDDPQDPLLRGCGSCSAARSVSVTRPNHSRPSHR